jgi:hypothetical protein
MRRFVTTRVLAGALAVSLIAVAALVFLLVTNTGGGGKSSQSSQDKSGPGTVFLYAVQPGSTHILTYSPVQGTVSSVGGDLDKVPTTDADTQNGQLASCIAISDPNKTAAGENVALPFLSWTDLEGQDQQQFFNKGQIVYVCNHYLKRTAGDDTELVSLPK